MEVQLSVRTLVEFLLRGGSIDNRFGGSDRGAEGSRLHRMLQKEAGGDYRPEQFLSLTVERGGVTYTVQGRADGVILQGGGVTIDEIKTTAYPLELIGEDFQPAHWGQAMCYGYFYCVEKNLAQLDLRLTYFQIDTEEIKRFTRTFTREQLEQFYLELLDRYAEWAALQSSWKAVRDASIRDLPFPFDRYRKGQRNLAAAVYRTVRDKKRLFCQAPTGIGKTVSTLYPSVKAMGEGHGEKIFYLTAKTITRQAAEEAYTYMEQRGLAIKTVTLTAKDKICFLEERDCNPEKCPYANGYYDRINDALYSLLQSGRRFTRGVIEEAARQHRLCPFELSLDLTLWCDGIICDYNYLFDPVAYLQRFFAEEGGDYIFLVDEAHNLVDRSRSMYSAALNKSAVLALKKKCKAEKPLSRALGKVNQSLLTLRKECEATGGFVRREAPTQLLSGLSRFVPSCEEWLREHKDSALHADVLPFYFEVRFFQRISELYDEHYATYIQTDGKDVIVKMLCLDPSRFLDRCMGKGRAAVLFSATLSPLDYFIDLLGGGESALRCSLPSPFDPAHLCLLNASYVSTKYIHRAESLLPVAELLYRMTRGKPGNYMAYFPSYQYMREVYRVFREQYPEVETLLQIGGMGEEEREAFLGRFAEGAEETLLGFCVLGGIYSEGVDLRGDRLIGTAVVGVGLPQINAEQDILRDYYDEHRGMGFEFSYRYPGMNKVLQAAGRVIRGENDRGVVLLIDSRFTAGSYRCLFPSHWSGCETIRSAEELDERLARFWSGTDG